VSRPLEKEPAPAAQAGTTSAPVALPVPVVQQAPVPVGNLVGRQQAAQPAVAPRQSLVVDGIHVPGTRNQNEYQFVKELDRQPLARLLQILLALRQLPAPTQFDHRAVELVWNELESRKAPHLNALARLINLPTDQLARVLILGLGPCLRFAETPQALSFLCRSLPTVGALKIRQLLADLDGYRKVLDDPVAGQQFETLLGWYDLPTAGVVIRMVVNAPGTAKLLLHHVGDTVVLGRLVAVPAPELVAIADKLSSQECLAFGATDQRLDFLVHAHRRTADTRLRQLASKLEQFDELFANASVCITLEVLLTAGYPIDLAREVGRRVLREAEVQPLFCPVAPDLKVAARLIKGALDVLPTLAKLLPPATLLSFAGTDGRWQFLLTSKAAVPKAELVALGSRLDEFDPCLQDKVAAGDFGALLSGLGLSDLAALLTSCPPIGGPTPAKVALIRALLGPGGAAPLLRCLTLCAVASWGNDPDLIKRVRFLGEIVVKTTLSDVELTKDVLLLLDAHRPRMINDPVAVGHVAGIIQGAPTVDAAAKLIELLADFGYDPARTALAQSVDVAAAGHAAAQVAAEKKAIDQQAAQQTSAEIAKHKAGIVGNLSNKRARMYEGKKGSDAQEEVAAAVLAEQKSLAAPAVALIDQAADAQRATADNVLGPTAKAAKKAEYVAYFRSVAYHPAAQPALEFVVRKRSGGQSVATAADFTLAENVVRVIVAAPGAGPLMLVDQLNLVTLSRLVATPVPVLAWMVTVLPVPQCVSFAVSDSRLAFLTGCRTKLGTHGKLPQIAVDMGKYEKLFGDDDERAALIDLVDQCSLGDIGALLSVIPAYMSNIPKMRFLVGALSCVQGAPLLVQVMNPCFAAGWNHHDITAFLTGLPMVLTPGQMALVHHAILVKHGRDTNFGLWVRAVGVLLDVGYLTIGADDWEDLPGGTTSERRLRIYVGNNQVNNFVVHFHPGAVPATPDNPNASKWHVKPIRGNTLTPRVYLESIPAEIKKAWK
jgi:hypothetical protein